MAMTAIRPYTVTFTGDYFTIRTSVELDLDDLIEDSHPIDDVSLRATATALATNILQFHYGWDVPAVSHEIEATEG
jgi:hypothetical protein